MKKYELRELVDGAVMTALAAVLCYIRIIRLPWGGSVTLMSMLPIIVYSIKYGVKKGMLVSFAFSLIQLFQGISDGLFSWGLSVPMLAACILIDYIGAYSVIGIGGIFREKGIKGWICGAVCAGFARFVMHFISGVVIWKSFGELWSGFKTDNVLLYSFVYNGAYMLPEIIFTVVGAAVLFGVPQTRRIICGKTSFRPTASDQ
ncbi:MAG: energy-coupled thiamine transporter ThiT [Oscillospiraceae bacterium]|nr:energy-coupled thiamine transporter ThiT [Oscillospiraceae bacterium]